MRNLIIALVTVAVLLGALAVSPAVAQAPRTLIDWLIVDRITVLNGNVSLVSGNLTLDSGDMTVTAGDATVTAGDLAVTAGDIDATAGNVDAGGYISSATVVNVGTDLNIGQQSGLSVTDGSAFTVTGSYQEIQASGEVTPTIAAGAGAMSAGDIVILVNTSANTINLEDTGTAKLSAAAALGQYDTLTLLSDGSNWVEISRSDN